MSRSNSINRLIILLLVFSSTGFTVASGQGTWEKLTVPTHHFLRSVFFADSLYGWISGDSGTIIHTRDGGNTWEVQESGTGGDIMELFFINRNHGWASAFNYLTTPYGTTLLKTTNGGTTWELYTYPEENIFITCIHYHDSLNGFMGGKPHKIVYTNDGGGTWTQAEVDTSILAFFPILNLEFYDKQYGWACGGLFDIAGVVWRTSDGGRKWYAIAPSDAPADEVHALHAFDSLRVMGAGGDPDFGYGVGIIRTNDGGVNWNYEELGMAGFAVDLDFRTAKEAWAPLGNKMQFIVSLDTGKTWQVVATPGSSSIFDVHFPDSSHGFAVGSNGSVLRFLPPPVPGWNESDSVTQMNFIRSNFPNPFTRTTTIRFTIPSNASLHQKSQFRISVYDIRGKLHHSIPVQHCASGIHSMVLDLEILDSGYYLCFLEMNVSNNPWRSNPVRMVKIPY